jgi:hypothetical protein
MADIFYFLHIPKTAGTTFCFSVLPQFFASADICPAHDYPELLPIPRTELDRYTLFRGHFYYFLVRFLPKRPIMMTFLRDPVERLLSLYDHIYRDPKHYQHAALRSLPGGLRDAVRSPWLLPNNFQVTSLACELDPTNTMDAARAAHPLGLDEYSVIYTEMTKHAPTKADFETACQRLSEMEFVGLVERFAHSVELLCETFKWPMPIYESLNIAPARTRRDSIPADILQEIMDANELDLRLYEYATSLFLRRLSERSR